MFSIDTSIVTCLIFQSIKILDDKPVFRQMEISAKALTLLESECLSNYPRLLRRPVSTNSFFDLTTSDQKPLESDRTKDDMCITNLEIAHFQEKNRPSTPSCALRYMATVRVISKLRSKKNKKFKDDVVFEIAPFEPCFQIESRDTTESGSLVDWLLAIREHVEEQGTLTFVKILITSAANVTN